MKKHRLIIVENDEDEQFFMKEGFDAAGLFEIIAQVINGEDLFEWMESNPLNLPDFILSDLNMPGKNGYDIIAQVTTSPLYQHIPVIITSTSSTKTIIDKCLNMGASEYMVKPDTFIEYNIFVKKLHNIIKDKQLVK